MSAFDQITKCIEENKSFVLQGGAGSGKTETLKQTLDFIANEYPDNKVLCIAHTNSAVDEIKSRIDKDFLVSTIHSFLNNIIKDYKKNLHQLVHELFTLTNMERNDIDYYGGDETTQKKIEHAKYKKLHGKYASTLFTVKAERADKVEGKREYDKKPEEYNTTLNNKITELNTKIIEEIKSKDFNKVNYNETRFNSFSELSYGHDGLIDISFLLFDKYPLIGKILQDKYDCIFIDEYQDTRAEIIDIFLKKLPKTDKTLIGLFGDSMQAIYDDGIGSVKTYVDGNLLININKEDNYRCSEQVIIFINNLRNNSLQQDLALKKKTDGSIETIEDRQGEVKLYYSLYPDKPNHFSAKDDKEKYLKALEELIVKASEGDNYRQLKLTNKSIASDVGFEKLFQVFSDRYVEPQEYMERNLAILQFTALFELCDAYKPLHGKNPDYNLVINRLKKQGFVLRKMADKVKIKECFDKIIDSDKGAYETLQDAITFGLIKKSEKHNEYLERRDSFLLSECEDDLFKKFKVLFHKGKNTFPRIKNDLPDINEDDFNELKRILKREAFYEGLFSSELGFKEILNYYYYLNDETQYITMHKTKGSNIDNVLVVLDEYFWNQYNFQTAFSKDAPENVKEKNQKLVYVACSRAKKNLRCVRLVSTEDEEKEITEFFDKVVKAT